MDSEQLTFGQKAVGLSFNPSGQVDVVRVKTLCAELIDLLNNKRVELGQGNENVKQAARHLSIAITDVETAQMRAVKALTWEV